MDKRRRVVITGMGIVSCFGNDVAHFYEQLLAGKSGVKPLEEFPCQDYPTRFAATIRDFDAGDYMDKKQARRVDKFVSYGVVAGKKALEYAKLDAENLSRLNKYRCGILLGSGMGGMSMFSDGVETLITKGFKRITPFFVPYIITNIAGAILAIDLGFMGPNYSISTACATASHCIYSAAKHIRDGEADLMICGGTESPITPIGLAGFVACKALSERNDSPEKACRPWDKNRDGFVMGEGAGVLVLESLEHALARGAPILAEYLGGAISCDAYHITSPWEDGKGVALCIENAISDAQVRKDQVNYVNAHGTATPVGDLCEVRAMKAVFGDQVYKLKMNATKSLVGHCLGAAGGIEAIATLEAIRTGMLHPTINIDDPEEEIAGIDIVANEAKPLNIEVAMSNSFGFGGHNCSLLFAPYRS
jgi:3-oxoacyl-[acyl-carrier-protein] synthase II